MASPSKILVTLARGWRRVCPRCGQGPLFEKWGLLNERCPACGWEIRKHEHNTFFFMYVSTAAITGLFVVGMLLVTPANQLVGKLVVGAAGLGAFLGTHSRRKGMAVALEFLTEGL